MPPWCILTQSSIFYAKSQAWWHLRGLLQHAGASKNFSKHQAKANLIRLPCLGRSASHHPAAPSPAVETRQPADVTLSAFSLSKLKNIINKLLILLITLSSSVCLHITSFRNQTQLTNVHAFIFFPGRVTCSLTLCCIIFSQCNQISVRVGVEVVSLD